MKTSLNYLVLFLSLTGAYAFASPLDQISCEFYDSSRPGYYADQRLNIVFPHVNDATASPVIKAKLSLEQGQSKTSFDKVDFQINFKVARAGNLVPSSFTAALNRFAILDGRIFSDGQGGEYTRIRSSLPLSNFSLPKEGALAECLYLDGTIHKPGFSGSN